MQEWGNNHRVFQDGSHIFYQNCATAPMFYPALCHCRTHTFVWMYSGTSVLYAITIFSRISLWIASGVWRCAFLDSISCLRQAWKAIHTPLHSISFTVFRGVPLTMSVDFSRLKNHPTWCDAPWTLIVTTSVACLVCIGDTRVNAAISMIVCINFLTMDFVAIRNVRLFILERCDTR